MMTQSELERERYESRLKLQRDIYTALKEARDEGEEKGRQEGRIERINFLQRLLRQALTPVDELQKQAPADLERLVEQLEAEALARMGNGS
jgi:flagellar biosynthesis/type III secretory pathway protein FliH